MSGYLGGLSPSQEEALSTFRKEVENVPKRPYSSDDYYLKWLRARNFDIEASLTMFQNHMKWREEWDADNALNWEHSEVLTKYLPGSFFGEDRKGRPVFYDFMGNLDVKGLHRSLKIEEGLRYKIYHAELGNKRLQEQSEKHGRPIETIIAIVDMEGLSYQRQYHWQGLQLIRKAFTLFAENYPERTETIFIINAPMVFPLAFNLVKTVMDESTRNKIFVLGDDYKEVLLKHIAPDQLPEAFGGERREPDPQCSDFITWGGTVPERYYLKNQTNTRKENMNKVTVGRGSVHEHEIRVETKGITIRWEFMTEDHDIGFGVLHKPVPGAIEHTQQTTTTTIVSTKRRNSHVIPEEGIHECQEVGTYVLVFDNSHSWLRAKDLYYCVEHHDSDTSELIQAAAGLSLDNGAGDSHKDCANGGDNISLEEPRVHET